MSGICARATGRRQRLAAVHVMTKHVMTAHAMTARGIADSGVQPRHLGRGPERAPQVLVAGNDAHEGVNDRHAVPAPPDDVDAGAHRGERGTPRGGTIHSPSIRNILRTRLRKSLRRRNPHNGIPTAHPAGGTRSLGHGLVPRAARSARSARRTRRARSARRTRRARSARRTRRTRRARKARRTCSAHSAHGTRGAHGLSCRSRRGRRPSWTRPGRGWRCCRRPRPRRPGRRRWRGSRPARTAGGRRWRR